MIKPQPGDYVRFTRHVVKLTRFSDPLVVMRGGTGLVLSVNKATKKVKTGTRYGEYTNYHVAKIDAGPVLGVVTAILNDAVIVGKQEQLDFGD